MHSDAPEGIGHALVPDTEEHNTEERDTEGDGAPHRPWWGTLRVDMSTDDPVAPPSPTSRSPVRVLWRVLTKAWDDSIFGMSAEAAFWQTLSLPPLLLGLLGSIGYVGRWFGEDTPALVQEKIIAFCRSVFSPSVVEQIIEPTVADILSEGRGSIVSLGFLLSLWAGSSAISSFVDSIVVAHDQHDERHPVWQRIFALLLYAVALLLAVFILPLVAVGPELLTALLPDSWQDTATSLIDTFYYPTVALLLVLGLTTLYKVALPRPLPWHRLIGGAVLAGVFFVAASALLRAYLQWVTSTGYSYGALAAPIAYLLFTYFLGFAIVLGAELNAVVQEFWPARATRIEQMRERMAVAMHNGAPSGPITAGFRRVVTGPALNRAGPPAQSPPPGRRPS